MTEPDVQLPLIAEVGPLKVAEQAFVTFELEGEPRAWERPGATIRFGGGRPFIHWFVRSEEAAYRESLAWAAKAAMRGKEPTSEPVAVIVHAFMGIPTSWPWKKKQAARSGAILPTGKPDWDNLGKILDALTGIVWTDDAGVVDGRVLKRFSQRPGLRIEVCEFLPPK